MFHSSSPRPPRARALALALLAASGCSSGTKISRAWSDPTLEKDRFRKVMVLVMAASHARRETAEDRIYKKLTEDGVDVVRSYDTLPDHAIADRERIREAVEASGADALLAVKVTGVSQDAVVQEGREQWVPSDANTDYYGYVTMSYELARKPEVYESLVVSTETTLWDVASRKMVWAAQSDSRSRSETPTTAQLTDDFADVVVKKVRPYLREKR
jgi:hypothetical protein